MYPSVLRQAFAQFFEHLDRQWRRVLAAQRKVVFADLLFELALQNARRFGIALGLGFNRLQIDYLLPHLPQRENHQRERECCAEAGQRPVDPIAIRGTLTRQRARWRQQIKRRVSISRRQQQSADGDIALRGGIK